MLKKYLLSVVIVFLVWSVIDFVVHGVILASAYQATAAIWRPMAEMKIGLMYLSTFLATAAFCAIYMLLVNPKSLKAGVIYGLLVGLLVGVPMAIGTYSVMPITVQIAAGWFGGMLVEMVFGGLCLGMMSKK
jgi:hypothetical protein